MKFQITFKDPDGVDNGIKKYTKALFENLPLTEEEKEDCSYKREESISKALEKWINYGEYITIEFDLIAKTAKVVDR